MAKKQKTITYKDVEIQVKKPDLLAYWQFFGEEDEGKNDFAVIKRQAEKLAEYINRNNLTKEEVTWEWLMQDVSTEEFLNFFTEMLGGNEKKS